VRPDLVASVTTVGSPHKGADLADFLVANFANGGFTQAVLSGLGNALGTILGLLGWQQQSERRDRGAPRAHRGVDGAVQRAVSRRRADQRVRQRRDRRGQHQALLVGRDGRPHQRARTSAIRRSASASLFYNESNDGLVERCSSRFGSVIRDNYFMNHLDEVNQVLGLVSIFESNPTTVFRAHANRLKNAGL
jgi:triacylglycerol lipase